MTEPDAVVNRTLCWFDIHGGCAKTGCPFVHPGDRQFATNEFRRKGCLRVCKYDQDGLPCPWGDECRFAHLRPTQKARPIVPPAVQKASKLRGKLRDILLRQDPRARPLLAGIENQLEALLTQADAVLAGIPAS